MKMRAFASALFAVSVLGFIVSLISHVGTYWDRLAQSAVRLIPVEVFLCLPLGVIVLAGAFIFFANALRPRYELARLLRDTPAWFRGGLWALLFYVVFNLVFTYSTIRANEPLGLYMVRTFSGQVMCVYVFLMAVSYLAIRVTTAKR
jgi:hypothetical protein